MKKSDCLTGKNECIIAKNQVFAVNQTKKKSKLKEFASPSLIHSFFSVTKTKKLNFFLLFSKTKQTK
jgi:hypothetical protein